MIELRAVTKTYGHDANKVHALRDVSFKIGGGEYVSIMGPSGSGKSTLLAMLSALDTPSSGQVLLDGADIGKLDDDALTLFRRRKIGLIFQFFNLMPALDALDNVLLPVMLERKVSAQDKARGKMLLEEVGLADRVSHRIHQLSGGQMQRVAIARALMLAPPIVLADEPTGSLDSTTGSAVLGLLRSLCDKHGATVVMVTHDAHAAETGDRIISLKDGALVDDSRTRRHSERAPAKGAAE
ncbi:MAG TPA: ABC transporter ATP-binding protein [Polyangiales bacterium]|nr:ABC transporter ATP-binding protein [Polyangiales bacterium]